VGAAAGERFEVGFDPFGQRKRKIIRTKVKNKLALGRYVD